MDVSVATRPIQMSAKRTNGEIDAFLADARPWLYRLALAIVAEPNLAEDVAQETLIRANRARRQLAASDHPTRWIQKVLVRRALTALPQRRIESAVEASYEYDPNLALAVRQTLERLSAMDRTILALTHFEELSYAEIADVLNIPVGTVGSRLHAARAAFKEAWQS
ncbi:MAG: RNA polymerase sigma factor [Fimbriimonadaceae bacterium]